MHTAQITRFGDWRAVHVAETTVPDAAAGQVLVRVSASSLNAVDAAHREGRLTVLAGRRLPQGLGIDLVGTIEGIGANVTGLQVGDRVWGIRAGAFSMKGARGLTAEYAVVNASQVARAPESLDDVQAAALVVGGYTSLRALRDVARLQPGERVLVRGGTGGVGSAAVPIAAAMGGRVAVLASARNEDLALGLGAHEFFDYATATPASVGSADVILDTVGSDLLAWRRLLSPGGRMVSVAFDSLAGLVAITASSVFGRGRIRTFAGEPPSGYLNSLSSFVDEHRIRALVHETFPLEHVQDAHRAFTAPGLRGKIVVTTAP